jgi:hypothetical protein
LSKSLKQHLSWNKKGNSNCKERKALTNRFISCFGREVIAGILADREFVGKQWFRYLGR